jgi:hypothetical protein
MMDMTREETSKYTEAVKDGKIRQFSFVMDARSIITYPAYLQQVQKGWMEIRGIDLNPVTSWIVQRDGKVIFKNEK